jgi:hypothetical protein
MGNDGVAQVLREYQVKLELHMKTFLLFDKGFHVSNEL